MYVPSEHDDGAVDGRQQCGRPSSCQCSLLARQADDVRRVSGRTPVQTLAHWLSRGRWGHGRWSPEIGGGLSAAWRDIPSCWRPRWRERAAYVGDEEAFAVDYIVCGRAQSAGSNRRSLTTTTAEAAWQPRGWRRSARTIRASPGNFEAPTRAADRDGTAAPCERA